MEFHYSKTTPKSFPSGSIDIVAPRVNESAFSFLFSEFLSYEKKRVTSSTELEQKMDRVGFEIGYKITEYLYPKVKPGKRPTKLMDVLQFISSAVWKFLFGKNIDSLERGTESNNEYMLTDFNPLCSKYISVPSDLGEFSSCSYVGGIIRGILTTTGFPCTVTAYDMRNEEDQRYALYLIRLE